jgi:tRNA(Ile)-lysidine synthase
MGHDSIQMMISKIICRWRMLSGGSAVRDPDRPTLVALSGGPDSSALLIALSSVKSARIVAAHIKHNLRPDHLQQQDSDAARKLADELSVEYHLSEISVPSRENAEAGARNARYTRLAEIALESGCHHVATGHHAQDQLETILIALIRGSGLPGLAGIAETRKLSSQTTLIRPALTSTREELESICQSIHWHPSHDETNDDLTKQRAWMRARVIPEILEHTDRDLPERLLSASMLARQAQLLVDSIASEVVRHAIVSHGSVRLDMEFIADEQLIIIGQVIRLLASTLVGNSGSDSRGLKHLQPIIDAVQTRSIHTKKFDLQGLTVEVSSRQLTVRSHSADINSVTSRTSRSTSDGSPEL